LVWTEKAHVNPLDPGVYFGVSIGGGADTNSS
jgi:hypothetical protein